MKISKSQILTFIAVLNSIFLGFISYLSVVAFRSHISQAEEFARYLIIISLIGSLITKVKMKSLIVVLASIFFDFIMVVYLYNPTVFNSIHSFLSMLLEFSSHLVLFVYLYLIIFYYLRIREIKTRIVNSK